jgi:serine/threonine-protein kinase
MLLNADDGDQVKVLDFGLVKSFVDGEELEGRVVTAQGVLVGSPGYMAPEQGEKNHADPRSDIYSLGAVLYEALTGAPPFTGMSAMEIILEHANAPLPPMVVPGDGEPIPVEMEALVTRCLAKSPMDRFQSMDEVLEAMQELTTPDRFRTEPIGIPVLAALPAARPRRPLALLVAVAVLLGATGAAATLRWLHPAAPAQAVLAAVAAAAPVEPSASPGAGVVFHVETFPPGATVTLDGTVVGKTPVNVAVPPAAEGVARATFELSLPGYRAISVSAWGTGGEVAVEESLHPLRPKKTSRRR